LACNTEGEPGAIADLLGEPHPAAAVSRGRDPRNARKQHYNILMSATVPPAIIGQKYISLTTFRKSGAAVATPVWFGEEGDKFYVMTRSDMGKTKRIRNNPQVQVAPCTIRGQVKGPSVTATARILPAEEHARARKAINRKYWAARLPLIWRRTDTYIEITFPATQ
jgi:hypothetical protein